MATNQTTNYDLNQWLSTDQVLRTDFNADNAKVDTALAGKAEQAALSALAERVTALEAQPRLITGYYEGDGSEERLISLGFTPKAVLVFLRDGYPADPYTDNFYGGMAFPSMPAERMIYPERVLVSVVQIESGGFRVYYKDDDDVRSNLEGETYYYMSWK